MSKIAELIKNSRQKARGNKEEIQEQSREEISGEYFDLYPLLSGIADMLGEMCISKRLEMVFDLNWNTPKQLYGNEEQLRELLTELLIRTVEHTEAGKIVLGITFEKKEDSNDRVLFSFSVMCTGDGIAQDEEKKLKELFTDGGYSLTSELVPDLGAKYSFMSEMGVAAWEPLGSFEKNYNEDLRKRIAIRENFTCPDAKILIVDDNPMNLEVIKSLLEHTKIKIDTAESGDEGIAKAAAKKYDLIFLDHMMPDKDGIETLREMTGENEGRDTIMICLTANAISGARKWYLSEGFDDYLAKPVTSEKLEDILLKHLPADKIIKGAEL